jgi:flagellar basal body-associated protein FliL
MTKRRGNMKKKNIVLLSVIVIIVLMILFGAYGVWRFNKNFQSLRIPEDTFTAMTQSEYASFANHAEYYLEDDKLLFLTDNDYKKFVKILQLKAYYMSGQDEKFYQTYNKYKTQLTLSDKLTVLNVFIKDTTLTEPDQKFVESACNAMLKGMSSQDKNKLFIYSTLFKYYTKINNTSEAESIKNQAITFVNATGSGTDDDKKKVIDSLFK